MSALNPLTLLSRKDEKEAKDASKDPDPQQKLLLSQQMEPFLQCLKGL